MPGKMRGAPQMIAKIRAIAAKFPDRVAQAVYQEAQIELTEAKRRTPVDTGALRASGQVSRPIREGKKIYCVISFGGNAVRYAVPVHENPDAHHPVGQWKYLESVLNESASHMAERIAKRIHLNNVKAEEL